MSKPRPAIAPATRHQTFRVSDILPNPFIDTERYPLQDDRISELRKSMRTTGDWPNLEARIAENGKPEIAYGRHRLEAIRREFGDDYMVDLAITEMDDRKIIEKLARENSDAWHSDALTDQAAVRAVVEPYGAGKIKLEYPPAKAPKKRHAPSFRLGHVPRAGGEHPYTVKTLRPILVWNDSKIEETLKALELIERGLLQECHYKGRTTTQARALTRRVRKLVHASDKAATSSDKKATEARSLAAKAESDEERRQHERRAVECEQVAAKERERLPEACQHEAGRANTYLTDGVDHRAVEQLEKDVAQREPREQPSYDEIDEYLYQTLPEATKAVEMLGPHVPQFSPEQIELAVEGGSNLISAVNAFNAVLTEINDKRQRLAQQPKKSNVKKTSRSTRQSRSSRRAAGAAAS
jgi:hypothetical protein